MKAEESGNVEPTPYRLLLRTKGVRNADGQRVLITEYDKKIEVSSLFIVYYLNLLFIIELYIIYFPVCVTGALP